MKPLDLQVNILKSLDLIAEKAKESILNSQTEHLEDKSKKERQSRDFYIAYNKETEEIKNKLPDKLPEQGKKESSYKSEDETHLMQESKEQNKKEPEFENPEELGKNIDIKG